MHPRPFHIPTRSAHPTLRHQKEGRGRRAGEFPAPSCQRPFTLPVISSESRNLLFAGAPRLASSAGRGDFDLAATLDPNPPEIQSPHRTRSPWRLRPHKIGQVKSSTKQQTQVNQNPQNPNSPFPKWNPHQPKTARVPHPNVASFATLEPAPSETEGVGILTFDPSKKNPRRPRKKL